MLRNFEHTDIKQCKHYEFCGATLYYEHTILNITCKSGYLYKKPFVKYAAMCDDSIVCFMLGEQSRAVTVLTVRDDGVDERVGVLRDFSIEYYDGAAGYYDDGYVMATDKRELWPFRYYHFDGSEDREKYEESYTTLILFALKHYLRRNDMGERVQKPALTYDVVRELTDAIEKNNNLNDISYSKLKAVMAEFEDDESAFFGYVEQQILHCIESVKTDVAETFYRARRENSYMFELLYMIENTVNENGGLL